jgi:5-(carboxyamino)imidazole ribonucleotide mutase
MLVPIIMGSKADLEFAQKIAKKLKDLGIYYVIRVASAHKAAELLLSIIKKYDEQEDIVYITVAGRSNALSGFVSANSIKPVIACPPLDKQSYMMDIHSSLRMPSNAPCMTVVDPKNAALAAAKILALKNPELKAKITQGIVDVRVGIEKDDKELQ